MRAAVEISFYCLIYFDYASRPNIVWKFTLIRWNIPCRWTVSCSQYKAFRSGLDPNWENTILDSPAHCKSSDRNVYFLQIMFRPGMTKINKKKPNLARWKIYRLVQRVVKGKSYVWPFFFCSAWNSQAWSKSTKISLRQIGSFPMENVKSVLQHLPTI